VDQRTLGCRDDRRSLGVWRRVKDIQQRSEPAGQLPEKSRISTLNSLLTGESEIEEPGINQSPEAEPEHDCEDDSERDRCRGAVPPVLHQPAPFNVTGAAKI
jgi:hypothetical protein